MKKLFTSFLVLFLFASTSGFSQSKSDKTQNNSGLSDFYIEMVAVTQADFPCLSCSTTPLSFEDYVQQVKTWITNNSTSYFSMLSNRSTGETLTWFDIKNYDVEKYGRIKNSLSIWSSLLVMQYSINENFSFVTELKNTLFGKSEGKIYLFLIHQNDLHTYFKNI